MLTVRRPSRILSAAGAIVARQSVLLANAGAITAGNLITAMLGFFYWWLAAHRFSAAEVGFAAAAVSLMNLLAQIGEFGMGPLLISELPGQARTAGAFISATLTATLASAILLGVVCLALGHVLSIHLGRITGPGLGDAIFLMGVAVTGFTVVLDQAFVGLLKSQFSLLRNVSFAVLKLLLLVAVAVLVPGHSREGAVFATWVGGSFLSLVVLFLVCAYRRQTVWHTPNLRLLRPMIGRVLGHHALNVAIQAPALVLPVVVTVLLSAQVNAAFYAAWTLVNVVLLVPASLSSVVVSVARREPALLGRRIGFSLIVSGVVAAGASLGCFTLSTIVLGLFSPHYPAIAGTSLALLGLGTFGMTIKYHYIAAERFSHRMLSAAIALSAGGALEVGAAVLGAHFGGLDGFTRGWLIAVTLEALLMIPTLVKVVIARPSLDPEPGDTVFDRVQSYSEGAQTHASM